MSKDYNVFIIISSRGVVHGGAGGAMATPDFGRLVIPIYLNHGRQIMLTK
jgi:hypothetical protein